MIHSMMHGLIQILPHNKKIAINLYGIDCIIIKHHEPKYRIWNADTRER